MPRIIIFGGTGFLGESPCVASILIHIGSHLARAAIRKGCHPVSISRRCPALNPNPDLATYIKGDIFSPETYREQLRGSAAVIYSAGVLLEANYKQILDKPSISGVINLIGQLKESRNPLKQLPRSGYKALNRDGGTSSPSAV